MTVRSLIRSLLISTQKNCKIRPRGHCLIAANPRSGTTAFQSWLGRHRRVLTVPQLRVLTSCQRFLENSERYARNDNDIVLAEVRELLRRYYARQGVGIGRVIVDKENFEPIAFPQFDHDKYLENTWRLLPNCKVIFLVRNPASTIWSMINREWGLSLAGNQRFEYSLDESIDIWNRSAETIQAYRSHPNTLLCHFEDLVENPEATSNRVEQFLELPPGKAFEPRPTKIPGFDDTTVQKIVAATECNYRALKQ